MVKYSEYTCYWCGKDVQDGEKAYSSLATDTIKTMRNFCCEDHLLKFKKYAKTKPGGKRAGMYELKPYYGKNMEVEKMAERKNKKPTPAGGEKPRNTQVKRKKTAEELNAEFDKANPKKAAKINREVSKIENQMQKNTTKQNGNNYPTLYLKDLLAEISKNSDIITYKDKAGSTVIRTKRKVLSYVQQTTHGISNYRRQPGKGWQLFPEKIKDKTTLNEFMLYINKQLKVD